MCDSDHGAQVCRLTKLNLARATWYDPAGGAGDIAALSGLQDLDISPGPWGGESACSVLGAAIPKLTRLSRLFLGSPGDTGGTAGTGLPDLSALRHLRVLLIDNSASTACIMQWLRDCMRSGRALREVWLPDVVVYVVAAEAEAAGMLRPRVHLKNLAHRQRD